jgi:hypothetical protein
VSVDGSMQSSGYILKRAGRPRLRRLHQISTKQVSEREAPTIVIQRLPTTH